MLTVLDSSLFTRHAQGMALESIPSLYIYADHQRGNEELLPFVKERSVGLTQRSGNSSFV